MICIKKNYEQRSIFSASNLKIYKLQYVYGPSALSLRYCVGYPLYGKLSNGRRFISCIYVFLFKKYDIYNNFFCQSNRTTNWV